MTDDMRDENVAWKLMRRHIWSKQKPLIWVHLLTLIVGCFALVSWAQALSGAAFVWLYACSIALGAHYVGLARYFKANVRKGGEVVELLLAPVTSKSYFDALMRIFVVYIPIIVGIQCLIGYGNYRASLAVLPGGYTAPIHRYLSEITYYTSLFGAAFWCCALSNWWIFGWLGIIVARSIVETYGIEYLYSKTQTTNASTALTSFNNAVASTVQFQELLQWTTCGIIIVSGAAAAWRVRSRYVTFLRSLVK